MDGPAGCDDRSADLDPFDQSLAAQTCQLGRDGIFVGQPQKKSQLGLAQTVPFIGRSDCLFDFDFVDHNHPEQVDTQQVTIIIIHTILIPHTNKQQLRNDVETSLFKLLQTRDR